MIYIVGLGAGDENQIPYGVMDILQKGMPLYLRTDQHPMQSFFLKNQISYHSFDDIYEAKTCFEDVYEEIVHIILQKGKDEDILYAVPGHPCVAEYTVKRLLKEGECEIIGGQSFLDAVFTALRIDPIDGLQIMDALAFDSSHVAKHMNLIIPQVFDQISASNLKLDLMEIYHDEYPICIMRAVGSCDEKLTWIPLYALDHGFELSNLTTIFVPHEIDQIDIKDRMQLEKFIFEN